MNIIEKKFLLSRSIGAIIRAIAYILMAGSIIAILGLLETASGQTSGPVMIATGISLFIGEIIVFLSGELIRILIDVEENTRRSSWATVMKLPSDQWDKFGFYETNSGTVEISSNFKNSKTMNIGNQIVSPGEIKELKIKLKRNPGDADIALRLSEIYCHLFEDIRLDTQYQNALSYFKMALKTDPSLINREDIKKRFSVISSNPIFNELMGKIKA